MANIRMQVDEAALCVQGAQLILHGVRRDVTTSRVLEHIDIVLPWNFQRTLTNLDGINYESLDDHAA